MLDTGLADLKTENVFRLKYPCYVHLLFPTLLKAQLGKEHEIW